MPTEVYMGTVPKASIPDNLPGLREAEIGDVVLWYPDGDADAKPHAAIVTAIGLNALSLNIIGPDSRNFRVEDGVHHISDPYCRRVETRDAGGWDHTPRTKRLVSLLGE